MKRAKAASARFELLILNVSSTRGFVATNQASATSILKPSLGSLLGGLGETALPLFRVPPNHQSGRKRFPENSTPIESGNWEERAKASHL
jgi:hypothetical protein